MWKPQTRSSQVRDRRDSDIIASNKLQVIAGATNYHFGILTSAMHMAWMRTVAGRLESRYSYAPSVYNTFPWPAPNEKQRADIEKAAQAVLDARKPRLEGGASLADLYDPLTMPEPLLKAHLMLDRVVDRAYRKKGFGSEVDRVAFLFRLFEKLSDPLLPPPTRRKRKSQPAVRTKVDG